MFNERVRRWERLLDPRISNMEYAELYSEFGSRRVDSKFHDRKPADYVQEQLDQYELDYARTLELDSVMKERDLTLFQVEVKY